MSCDLISLAVPGVRQLKPYEPGKPVEEIERDYGVSEAIKLASNENPLGAGRMAREAIRASEGSLGRYPDGNGFALKRALARRFGVGTEQITLGNGSNDILELVTRAFVTCEHEVIFSEYAFAVYPIVTQAVDARAVVTPARNWGHDLKAMSRAVSDRTRLIFIANPNNPTGTWQDASRLREFMDAVPQHALVVVDEAYFEYVEHPDYPNCISWLSDYPNLVVTRTFSKIHGLAGLRVGYGVSHPDVADLLNRVRQPFNVNSMALAGAEAALHDTEHVAKSRALNSSGLQQLQASFDGLGLDYIPSVANFVCVDVQRSGSEVFEALLWEGVIVRPVENYGMPNHVRVTVGLEEENARFVKALTKFI